MDEVATYNAQRWDAMVRANALFTRPWLDLDKNNPLERVDPEGRYGAVLGRNVLCLASGGGQQSAAFSLAGAHVSVIDLSAGQIERDRAAARHYGYEIEAIHGDMRDLSMFGSDRFDLVYQPFSINFVPDVREVIAQVARVIRSGGIYELGAANPFAAGLGTQSWNGRAYELGGLYVQGEALDYSDEEWVFPRGQEVSSVLPGKEYRHLLSILINGLAEHGFVIRHLREEFAQGLTEPPEPGSWAHFTQTIPPWLTFISEKEPKTTA
jgi:ubiquinone/menaquinone biosynthesis C-methylase UbiE